LFVVKEEKTDDEDDDDIEKKDESSGAISGWIDIIFGLCNDDITKMNDVLKMNILSVCNWLLWNDIKNKKKK
jgi:hypothetical protein